MLRRTNGNPRFRNIYAALFAFFVYRRESLREKFFAHRRNVEEHSVLAYAIHFLDYLAGNYISGRKVGTRMFSLHKRFTMAVSEYSALSSYGFGDKKRAL